MTPAETLLNIESAEKYGRLCRVAIGFAIDCDSETEALYAYLNARWAARLALAELAKRDISARVLDLVSIGHNPLVALRLVCGDAHVDAMIDTLYSELRTKAVR